MYDFMRCLFSWLTVFDGWSDCDFAFSCFYSGDFALGELVGEQWKMDGQVDICAEIKDFAIASFGQLCLAMVSTQSLTKVS